MIDLDAYLSECRDLTLNEIKSIIPRDRRYREVLYDLMLDYPLRSAKALRPALCIATCRALGGRLESALRSAAALEMYHNAFLIHDDVEDGSEMRRGKPTLHRTHGAPIAVNVGDALLALTLQPLLDNTATIGLGPSLRILETVARMARESTEGQALELHWIRSRRWNLTDADYIRMVYKKTSWYTFIAPAIVGGIVAGRQAKELGQLRKFAALLGIAFQTQDDILNLTTEVGQYGKETAGDLWEGKHTLILMHMMRHATSQERDLAREILSKRRPAPLGSQSAPPGDPRNLSLEMERLVSEGELTTRGRARLMQSLDGTGRHDSGEKTDQDVRFLVTMIDRHESIEHARKVAAGYVAKARKALDAAAFVAPSVHRDFLESMLDFVASRDH
jgi:geranylgeranyl diphosphate synthase, type II